MIIDTTDLNSIIAAIIAIITMIYAWYQNRSKNTVIKAMTSGTVESQNAAVVLSLPTKSWTMNDETKEYITSDATPTNKARILAQVAAHEMNGDTHYRINFVGGYYVVDYGLVMSGVGNPSHDVGSDGANLADQFYTHKRTGRVWANKEMALAMDGAE
jgi:hypothetical protein